MRLGERGKGGTIHRTEGRGEKGQTLHYMIFFFLANVLCSCARSHQLLRLMAGRVKSIIPCGLDSEVSKERIPSHKGPLAELTGPSLVLVLGSLVTL